MSDLITKSSDEFIVTKFDAEAGSLSAYVTTYGNADVVGDVMARGVLDKFIKRFGYDSEKNRKPKDYDRKNVLPMLWNHMTNEPIGEWTKFVSDDRGVIGYGQIYTETTRGADVRALIQRGLVGAVSIGFRAIDYDVLESGGRLFKEIELVETSVVLRPANPKAVLLSAKDEDGRIDIRKLEEILRDVGLSQKERKISIAGIKAALSNERDVVDAEAEKLALVQSLTSKLR